MRDSDYGRQHGLELAYRYLNPRDRTEAEVRGYLDGKGLDAGDVERSIATLRDQGYLDDARYARLLAQDKRNLEGWGSERIRRTLSARGIDRDLIDEAMDEAPAAELDRAIAVLRRRFPSPPQERRDRDRALAVLLRKGYDVDLAHDALARHANTRASG